jgi:ABC-2 type transport system permease protein
MRKVLRLLGEIFSVSLRRALAYRVNLLFQIAMTVVGVAASLATLGVVFSQTASLAGWSLAEATVLLGTFEIVSGFLNTFVQPNLAWFEDKVRNGEIDDVLLQPAPSIVLASLGTCNPLGLFQVALGLVVTIAGTTGFSTAPAIEHLFGYTVLVVTAVAIGWASRVVVASLAFWAPSVSLNMLYNTFWQLGRYPVDVYRQPIGYALTYVIPVAFIATIPARVLAQDANPSLLPGVLVVLVGVLVITRATWNAGLRRYTSATS